MRRRDQKNRTRIGPRTALWGAFGRVVQKAILQDSCFQPFINHPSDHTIRDSLVKKVSKVGVWNRIEVFYDARSTILAGQPVGFFHPFQIDP
jgi:hypothetical protein